MELQGRQIALISDNCPSHPPIDKPPKDYAGPPLPTLTHIKLIYLPKNTTPFLEPLDQGIIRSFKASYRRKYARQMVQYFNQQNKASPPLDILQTIYLTVQAWEELPPKVIYHCWARAGISPSLDKNSNATSGGSGESVKSYENYLQYLQNGTRIAIHTLEVIDHDNQPLDPGPIGNLLPLCTPAAPTPTPDALPPAFEFAT